MLYAVRFLYGLWGGTDLLKRRILVIGDNKTAEDAFAFCKAHPFLFQVAAISVDDCSNLKKSLHDYCLAEDIDEIVVAHDGQKTEVPVRVLLDCRTRGISLIEAGSFLERETGQVNLETGYPTWFLFGDGFRHVGPTLFMKRLLDIGMSGLFLALGAIPMMLTALAVWGQDRGPIFYTQVRTGLNGQPFKIYKFRSMRLDAEKNGAQWAKTNDDRITPVGHFIRKTRLDELPQIFNVFKGDMSFSGPRPERPEFVSQLAEQIPHFEDRHSLKPGITGWAQINYPYGASVDDAREKLKYDLYYVKNVSFMLDLVIILKTVRVVLWREGR
jgi:sugar transferase (PEP-CTERM system associated)